MEDYKTVGRSRSKKLAEADEQPIYAVVNKQKSADAKPEDTPSTSQGEQQTVMTSCAGTIVDTAATSCDEPQYTAVIKSRNNDDNASSTSISGSNGALDSHNTTTSDASVASDPLYASVGDTAAADVAMTRSEVEDVEPYATFQVQHTPPDQQTQKTGIKQKLRL